MVLSDVQYEGRYSLLSGIFDVLGNALTGGEIREEKFGLLADVENRAVNRSFVELRDDDSFRVEDREAVRHVVELRIPRGHGKNELGAHAGNRLEKLLHLSQRTGIFLRAAGRIDQHE